MQNTIRYVYNGIVSARSRSAHRFNHRHSITVDRTPPRDLKEFGEFFVEEIIERVESQPICYETHFCYH